MNSSSLISKKNYQVSSKEFILLINNLFLTITTFAILLGTLYPLITSSLDLGKISVGALYFNFIFSALMLPIVFLMAPAIYSSWKNTDYGRFKKLLSSLFFYSIIISYVVMNFIFESDIFVVYLAIFLAVFTILSSVAKLIQTLVIRRDEGLFDKIISTPSTLFANSFSHVGIGVLIIGITISTYFSTQKEIIMKEGTSVVIRQVTVKFIGVEDIIAGNYSSQVGIFDSFEDESYKLSFFPEKRTYNIQKNVMTEAAISSNPLRDIYIALGDKFSDDSWVVRIYYKPFIQFIWYGALLMILGGIFGIFGKEKFPRKT